MLIDAIRAFLIEDIGYGDKAGESLFLKDRYKTTMVINAKDTGVFAGSEVVVQLYRILDESVEVQFMVNDGDWVTYGQSLCFLSGRTDVLLAGERVLLNLLQRMCGIATLTAQAITILNDHSIQICDTRKTMPGLRMFDKRAVQIGGGKNHRFGLDDAVMLKENHIAASGSIKKAVASVKEKIGPLVKVEVETTNLSEVKEAVESGVDVIMFDNASPDEVKSYVSVVPDTILTEASGGIKQENLGSYAHTGVDYISLGYLTHSVKALDLSMLVHKEVFR